MMASENGGVMNNKEQFTVAGADVIPVTVALPVQDMHMPPVGAGAGLSMDSMKRSRGRPRKYGPDGSMASGSMPPAAPPSAAVTPPQGPALQPPIFVGSGSAETSSKKGRGRAVGSTSKPKIDIFGKSRALYCVAALIMGSAGSGLTPHVITVETAEDVGLKIMSFSPQRSICILSATGAISTVKLNLPGSGTVAYEGRFDILSLSGSFVFSENGGLWGRAGGINICLARDGSVFGGCVAGPVTAASPVQFGEFYLFTDQVLFYSLAEYYKVIVGTFDAEGQKDSKSANLFEVFPDPVKVNPGGVNGADSPPSHGTLSESSGGPGSPLN